MAYEAVWSADARDDVNGTLSYLVRQLNARTAASTLFDELARRIDDIRSLPESCPLARSEHLAAQGIRVSVMRNYLLLYQVDHAESRVILVRFLYAARDYARLL